MACPTCDRTMQKVGVMCEPYNEVGLFWCNRCGTLKANIVTEEADVPKLVSRITEFAGKLTDKHHDLINEFERLGIRESIMVDTGMI
jgi:hypothetical protein